MEHLNSSSSYALAWLMAVAGFITTSTLPAAENHEAKVEEHVQAMTRSTGGRVVTVRSSKTGLVRFLSSERSHPIPLATPPDASSQERMRHFINAHGLAFGLNDEASVRVLRVQERDEVGMERVRCQQIERGVPVTAGELSVSLRGNSVAVVCARTLPGLNDFNVVPTSPPTKATELARALVEKHFKQANASFSEPRLEVFNRGLLDGAHWPTRLAWFVEARGSFLREFIWVDAQSGRVLLHFSQQPHALRRFIYNAGDSSFLPGALVRNEGGPLTGNGDVDSAYAFAGDTYNYYFNQHGRDSFDGAGAALASTVRYCPGSGPCPYPNAFWNGQQMVYGEGFAAADDVVAHELTHAVTEYSAGLFYYMQSGALNESYSDIFGESVDLTNTGGNDSSGQRWLVGEDLPIGAIRSMMNPTAFGDPGKMSDPQFICARPGNDQGGVHGNSGVPNHAYALMVDGGTYNGYTISGIGLAKAARIQYRALTHYLLTGSDFLDNYNALKQACQDLIGTAGITAADCIEVGKALDAVEMAMPWPCYSPQLPESPPCAPGLVVTNLFSDDFESPVFDWVAQTGVGPSIWTLSSFFAVSGARSFWADDVDDVSETTLTLARDFFVSSSSARLEFKHAYGFEAVGADYYDGGVVEYSIDGGHTWFDGGDLIVAGATYGGFLSTIYGNPLGGRRAFVSDSFGYTISRLNLSSLAGQFARFRFRFGADESVGDVGWFIDDVRVFGCIAPEPPLTFASLPFTETWESGVVQPYWRVTGTGPYRSQLVSSNSPHDGAFHLTMDSSGGPARNEVTLGINLAGATNVVLSFWPGPGAVCRRNKLRRRCHQRRRHELV
jgi:Zn-dependent metalloprotease